VIDLPLQTRADQEERLREWSASVTREEDWGMLRGGSERTDAGARELR